MTDLAAAGRKYPWAPVAGFVLFAIIAFSVLTGSSQALDHLLFLDLAEWARAHPVLMRFLAFMSYVAEPVFRISGAVAVVILMLILRRIRVALFVVLTTSVGALLCSTAKALAARARPDLLPRLDNFDSYSFPSGHSWNGLIFYGEIALVAALFVPRRWRLPVVVLGMLLAFLTGWSRIALGVHWPSDVLAGWIGGGTWLLLCYSLLLGNEGKRSAAKSPVDP